MPVRATTRERGLHARLWQTRRAVTARRVMPASSHYTGLAGYAHDTPARAAVLLVNLGTPEAATPKAVREYLAEFLSDPRVIEYPRWLWQLVLHGVVLRVRPKRSAHAYASIWTDAGSPLRTHSEALAAALQRTLGDQCAGPVSVDLAMRYGRPALRERITALQAAGVRRLLLLPLYPQYSATSTGSVLDAMADTIKRLRWPPELRVINDYHDDAAHLDALADSVRRHWAVQGRGQKLLLSFHGIPRRYVLGGDPYYCQCQATARLLRERLGLGAGEVLLTFQSRVGRERWLQPATDATLRALPAQGVKRIDVLCPGFAVDCLETLEEIALRGKADFLGAGGTVLHYIPALNSGDAQVRALAALALRHMAGWPELAPDFNPAVHAALQASARERVAHDCNR
jgi:ferrochelatase